VGTPSLTASICAVTSAFPAGLVGFGVGADHPLVDDHPRGGRFDLDVFSGREQVHQTRKA
jgi:hypothetical protein